jgi:hypothetical protein
MVRPERGYGAIEPLGHIAQGITGEQLVTAELRSPY